MSTPAEHLHDEVTRQVRAKRLKLVPLAVSKSGRHRSRPTVEERQQMEDRLTVSEGVIEALHTNCDHLKTELGATAARVWKTFLFGGFTGFLIGALVGGAYL